MERESQVLPQPGVDLGVLVGGTVVQDHVDLQPSRCLFVEPTEEAPELLVTMRWHALADHCTAEDLQRREQRGVVP
jgi:hypothetical protein